MLHLRFDQTAFHVLEIIVIVKSLEGKGKGLIWIMCLIEFIKFNRIEIDRSIPNEDYFDIFLFVSIVLITVDTFELGILIHDGKNFIYLYLSTKTDDSCLF